MAKGKDKIEALVPVEEQPYPVPANWRWVRLANCCDDYFSGKSPKYSKEETSYYVIGQQANQRYGIDFKYVKYCTEEFTLSQTERYFLKRNDILLNTLGTGSIGRSGIYEFDDAILTDGHLFVFRTGDKYEAYLLYFFFRLSEDGIINTANGSTNQKFLSLSTFSRFPIPVPPKYEQRRIVNSILNLFNQLDRAIEKAQAVVDGYEDRKAAILHKAFTGELTEKWRKEQGINIEWTLCPLDQVFELKSGTTIDASEEKPEGDIPYIKVADMNLPGNDIQIVYSSRYVDSCQKNQVIPKGSTVFPKRGGAILTNKKRYVSVDIIADLNIMAIIPIDETVDGWYGYYWMQMINLKELNNGSNVPQINNKDMKKLFVPKPSIQEQREIVRILDKCIKSEVECLTVAGKTIDEINVMKKSILAKAFRGELGTNDPSEEPVDL